MERSIWLQKTGYVVLFIFFFNLVPERLQPSSFAPHSTATTMEAIAKYDFKATADDELSFKRGEVLKVSDSYLIISCFLNA